MPPVLSDSANVISHSISISDFEPLVTSGEIVGPGKVLASRQFTPKASVLDIAAELKLSPKSASRAVSLERGAFVHAGDVIAQSSGPFGLGKRRVAAPVSGWIEAVHDEHGVVIIQPDPIREDVESAFDAVVDTISRTAISVSVTGRRLHTAISIGPDLSGILRLASTGGDLATIVSEKSSRIVILFDRVLRREMIETIRKLLPDRRLGFVCPVMSFREFQDLERDQLDITVMVIDGFGSAPPREDGFDPVWAVLSDAETKSITLLPKRAGDSGIIVLPIDSEMESGVGGDTGHSPDRNGLSVGAIVRFLRAAELVRGVVVELPEGRRRLPSGLASEVAIVAISGGEPILVDRGALQVVSAGQTAN